MLAGTGHKAGHENEKPAKKPRLLAKQPSDENSQESIERFYAKGSQLRNALEQNFWFAVELWCERLS